MLPSRQICFIFLDLVFFVSLVFSLKIDNHLWCLPIIAKQQPLHAKEALLRVLHDNTGGGTEDGVQRQN